MSTTSGSSTDEFYEAVTSNLPLQEEQPQVQEKTKDPDVSEIWAPRAPPTYAPGQLGLQIRRKRIESIIRRCMDCLSDELENFPDGAEKAHYIVEVRLPLNDLIGTCRRLRSAYPLNAER